MTTFLCEKAALGDPIHADGKIDILAAVLVERIRI
jgi:hypothetical protein